MLLNSMVLKTMFILVIVAASLNMRQIHISGNVVKFRVTGMREILESDGDEIHMIFVVSNTDFPVYYYRACFTCES